VWPPRFPCKISLLPVMACYLLICLTLSISPEGLAILMAAHVGVHVDATVRQCNTRNQ
jgi:hypothetical protein